MRRSTETDLVRACLQLLQLRGVFAWRNNTTGVYDPTRKRFRTFTGMKGVSDIIGVLPQGRLLAVECKSATGRLTPEQRTFLDTIERLGGVSLVVRCIDDLESFLRDEQPPTPQYSPKGWVNP